jgi:hypothetical protein
MLSPDSPTPTFPARSVFQFGIERGGEFLPTVAGFVELIHQIAQPSDLSLREELSADSSLE